MQSQKATTYILGFSHLIRSSVEAACYKRTESCLVRLVRVVLTEMVALLAKFSDLALEELQLEPDACMEIRMRYLKRLECEVGSPGMVQSTLGWTVDPIFFRVVADE